MYPAGVPGGSLVSYRAETFLCIPAPQLLHVPVGIFGTSRREIPRGRGGHDRAGWSAGNGRFTGGR